MLSTTHDTLGPCRVCIMRRSTRGSSISLRLIRTDKMHATGQCSGACSERERRSHRSGGVEMTNLRGGTARSRRPPSPAVLWIRRQPKCYTAAGLAYDLRYHKAQRCSVSERPWLGSEQERQNEVGKSVEYAHRTDGALIRRRTSLQLGVRGGCRPFCPSGIGARPRGLLGLRSWGRSAASGWQ